jgi:hypothetical protein
MPTMLKQFRDSLHSRIAPENPCHPRFKALLCLFAHMAVQLLERGAQVGVPVRGGGAIGALAEGRARFMEML